MNILEGLGRAGYAVKESYKSMFDRAINFAENDFIKTEKNKKRRWRDIWR